jgi:WD40 repeat protein
MQADWELSQSFVSDSQGFRVACVLPASSDYSSAYRIVAGTQGGSLWEFEVPSGNLVPIDYQHNHAITALICGKDVYITGCKDHVIRVFTHEHALLYTFEGHEKAVTSLSLWGDDYLISGSWDGTAKVWNLSNKSLVAT